MGKIKFNITGSEEDIENTDLPVEEPSEDLSIEPTENTSEEIPTEPTEELFYASGIYDELRDAMQDTDFRLYLINNDIVIPGTLDGDEIQFLDIVGDEGEEEFVMKPAPQTMKELLEFKTLYNITNSEVEIPDDVEVQEAPHEKIVEYILSLKLSDEDAEDVEDDEQEIDKMEKEEEDDENESNEK